MTSASDAPPTLVAAGDIASCDEEGDTATADLIARLEPDAVATLGDNAYPSGTDATYAKCYGPTWGAFLDLTHPAMKHPVARRVGHDL